jgi:DNA-binding response OmpR family regulator
MQEDKDEIRAIVVDDDYDTVSVLSDFLQIKGIKVIAKGYDGQQAVELYKNLKPDVVFLDVMMKKYDGFYGLEKIRGIQHDAFVIAVTVDTTQKTYDRLTDLKASAIIYKPYDINEIMRVLDRIRTIRTVT